MTRTTFTRHPPAEAFAWAETLAPVAAEERVPLAAAIGRVLARPLHAAVDEPGESRAAIDGWAVAAADTQGASDYSPLPLRAGQPAPGGAVSVLAGQALPAGTDAVVPLERAEPLGSFVEVSTSLAVGDGVIPAAAEFPAGALPIEAGQVVRPQDLGLAALAGHTDALVRARPRVALALARAREDDPNGRMLSALIARDGGELIRIAPATDAVALEDFLRDTRADLLLVAGGSAFGANDHAVDALAACGQVRLDGVAMHPGETLALGEVDGTPVGVLPGTPLACLFAYDAVIARALRRLAGLPGDWPYHRHACVLARKVASTLGRMEFCRVRVDGARAEPIATADGQLLRTAVLADGFIVIPPESEGHAEGSAVDVMLYRKTG